MDSENAIIAAIFGIFTFYLMYSLPELGFSLGSVLGKSLALILAIVFGFMVSIIVLNSISKEK